MKILHSNGEGVIAFHRVSREGKKSFDVGNKAISFYNQGAVLWI